jgi:predicted nucleotidyltransferase
MQEHINLIQEKSPGAIPLLIVIRGSQAYGTSLPTSDTDYAGVYIQSIEDILVFGYKDQINDTKNDTVFYEVKRFLELLGSNNPNILELLNTPEDCILYKNPIMDEILKHKEDFITKTCAKSFAGYAIQQIKKAKGQDKKQNWEKDKVNRKTPLDFCYLLEGTSSISLSEYFKRWKNDGQEFQQQFCGLSKIPHSRDTYSLYFDYTEKIGFRGIAFEDSNDIRLSSIPVDIPEDFFIGYISYNKDGYTTHCDDYKSYQTWLENRNEQRWVDVESHGQKIDGKNMMHCRRLLEMAKEIAECKGINVRRPNAEYLISIRKGEVDLQTLIDNAELDIKEIDTLFANSTLPKDVSSELINSLLVNIRKEIYKI